MDCFLHFTNYKRAEVKPGSENEIVEQQQMMKKSGDVVVLNNQNLVLIILLGVVNELLISVVVGPVVDLCG